jgi:MscS family membrane protein
MKQLLHQTFLCNTIIAYLMVLAAITLAICIKRWVSKYLAGVLFRLVDKNNKRNNKSAFVNLIIPPLEWFITLLIAFVALDKLNFPTELDFVFLQKVSTRQIAESVANGALVITFIWLCLRAIDFIAMVLEQKANNNIPAITDNQFVVFFRDFFKVIVVLLGFLMLLHFSFNRNVGNILTGLSIVGAALALATRESLENLIASFIIFFDKPFSVGENVKVQNFTGTIEKIGLRSTRIRTLEKTFITVPNKQMVDSIVDNISLRSEHKGELKLEVDIEASHLQLTSLLDGLRQLLNNDPAITHSLVHLSDTGKNAHVVQIDYFTSMAQSQETFLLTKEHINLRCIALLHELGIDFASVDTDIVIKQTK